MRKHTNVSIEATPDYVSRLVVYAKLNRTTVGRMVRQALDAQFGQEVDIFFSKPVSIPQQNTETETRTKKVS